LNFYNTGNKMHTFANKTVEKLKNKLQCKTIYCINNQIYCLLYKGRPDILYIKLTVFVFVPIVCCRCVGVLRV